MSPVAFYKNAVQKNLHGHFTKKATKQQHSATLLVAIKKTPYKAGC